MILRKVTLFFILLMSIRSMAFGNDCALHFIKDRHGPDENRVKAWLQSLVLSPEGGEHQTSFLNEAKVVWEIAFEFGKPSTKHDTEYEYILEDQEISFASSKGQRQAIIHLAELMITHWAHCRVLEIDVKGRRATGWSKLIVSGPSEPLAQFITSFEFLLPRLGKLIGEPFRSRPFF